eukprot:70052-Pleurochrysis_carterae.AAC.1
MGLRAFAFASVRVHARACACECACARARARASAPAGGRRVAQRRSRWIEATRDRTASTRADTLN